MKKIISRITDWFSDRLRCLCGAMSPGRRVITIVALIIVFAVINFYITFKAIYNIGREDAARDVIRIIPRDSLEFLDDKATQPLQQEMEDFFNKQFNSERNDTTIKE